jgi:hypothetical protein
MRGGCVNERNTSSSLLADECAHRGQGIGTRLRHGREPQLARVRFHLGDLRQQGDPGARRLELRGLFEAQAHGMMVAGARLERGRGFIGHDAAVGDDDGACAHLVHLLQDVRGNDDQLVLAELVDQAPHFVLLIGVEPVGGFVQDQDLRIVYQCLSQADAAAKPLGERFDHLFDHRRESEPVDDDAAALPPPFPGEAAHVGDKIQKFAHRHFAITRGAFRQVSHAGLGRHRRPFDVVPAHRDLAGGRRYEARDHAHGRGLARAVGAQESQHLAGCHGKCQIIDREFVAIAFG